MLIRDDSIRPKRRFNPASRCSPEIRQLRRELARAVKTAKKPRKPRRTQRARSPSPKPRPTATS
jgi:hypothetical protein